MTDRVSTKGDVSLIHSPYFVPVQFWKEIFARQIDVTFLYLFVGRLNRNVPNIRFDTFNELESAYFKSPEQNKSIARKLIYTLK